MSNELFGLLALSLFSWIAALVLWINREPFIEATVRAWTSDEYRGRWFRRLGPADAAAVRRNTIGGARLVTIMLLAIGSFGVLAGLGFNTAALILFGVLFLISPFAFLFLIPPYK